MERIWILVSLGQIGGGGIRVLLLLFFFGMIIIGIHSISAYDFSTGTFSDTMLSGNYVALKFGEFNVTNCQAGYHFSSTSLFNDSCSGIHNGTLLGGASINSNGLNLSGGADYATIPVTSANNLSQRNYTVSLWFNTDVNNTGTLFQQGQYVSNMNIGSSRTLTSKVNDSLGCYVSSGVNSISVNKWYHAVLVYTNNESGGTEVNDTIELYLNGVKQSTAYCPGWTRAFHATNVNITFGKAAWYSGDTYNGTIDEVIIFNRSLSSSEVLTLYNQRALVGYYNSSVYDSTNSSYSLNSNLFRWLETNGTSVLNISAKVCNSSDNVSWSCSSDWDSSTPLTSVSIGQYWKAMFKFEGNLTATSLLEDLTLPPKNTYYVDLYNLSGTCNNSYTAIQATNNISRPFCNFSSLDGKLSAGDTVYIRNGTYYSNLLPVGSGNLMDYIYWKVYPGETVILDGRNSILSTWSLVSGYTDLWNSTCRAQSGVTNGCALLVKNDSHLNYLVSGSISLLTNEGNYFFNSSNNQTYMNSSTNPNTNGYTYYTNPSFSTFVNFENSNQYVWIDGLIVQYGNNDAFDCSLGQNDVYSNIRSYYTTDDGASIHGGCYNIQYYNYTCDNSKSGDCLENVGDSTGSYFNLTAINPLYLICLGNTICNFTGLSVYNERHSGAYLDTSSGGIGFTENATGFIRDAYIYNSSGHGITITRGGSNGNSPRADLYNVIIEKVLGVSAYPRYGLFINTTQNITYQDGSINDTVDGDVYIAEGNHNFINVSYNTSKVVVSSGSLTRKWYLDFNLTNSSGDYVNATINIYDNSSNLVNTLYSNNNFLRTNLTEYYKNSSSEIYYSNYTINISSNYGNISHSLNLNSNLELDDILGDSYYPQFSNNLTSIANGSQYNLNNNYQFNITIQNTNGTAGIEFNGTNYTLSNISNSFYWNVGSLGAVTYSYYFWAYGNGTNHNFNNSQTLSYSILNNNSLVYAYLNNSRSNITIMNGTAIYLNATRQTGEGIIQLYNNGTLINSGSGPLSNLTNFTILGLFNITAIYPVTQNYSASSETWWVNVTNITSTPSLYCGDGTCNNGETCSSCAGDCGQCQSTGGGGGIYIRPFWDMTYTNDYAELKNLPPLLQSLEERERVIILIDTEKHSVGVTEINGDKVTINVSSNNSKQAILGPGESAKFEINNDSYYDIKVLLNNIYKILGTNKANITITYIHEKMPNNLIDNETNLIIQNSSNNNSSINISNDNSDKCGIGQGENLGVCIKNIFGNPFLLFVAFLVIFIIWAVYKETHKKKNYYTYH